MQSAMFSLSEHHS